MAKKSSTSPKKVKKRSRTSKKVQDRAKSRKVAQSRVAKTEAEHLQILIRISKAHIKGDGSGLDEFFTQQVKRLEKQLYFAK